MNIIPIIREKDNPAREKAKRRATPSVVQRQMVQKFINELNHTAKQSESTDNAENVATKQLETAAREIVHEVITFPRSTGQRPVHGGSTDSHSRAAPEQTNQPRHAPNAPQRAPTPTPQEQARNAFVRQAKQIAAQIPEHPEQPDRLPLQKQARERTDDLKIRTESSQPQKSVKKLPQEQARRTFLKQKQLSRTEDFSVRDPLLTETPEILENPHFPEHGAVPTKAAPDSHIRQAGEWTPRSETTQTVSSEQPPTISARDVPPTPQARMRDAFVKTQKRRAQNPSIKSTNPSERSAPILPQAPVSDALAITPERPSVSAGSEKPASPTPQPVQPIAPPQIQPIMYNKLRKLKKA